MLNEWAGRAVSLKRVRPSLSLAVLDSDPIYGTTGAPLEPMVFGICHYKEDFAAFAGRKFFRPVCCLLERLFESVPTIKYLRFESRLSRLHCFLLVASIRVGDICTATQNLLLKHNSINKSSFKKPPKELLLINNLLSPGAGEFRNNLNLPSFRA